MGTIQRQSVALNQDVWRQIDHLSAKSGRSKSDIIRSAVSLYLDFEQGRGSNPNRIAVGVEFSQLALDVLVRQLAPDRREEILATVSERMKKYHAG